jgi:MerR family transcriptional regulator, heat shock protein HspR
MEINFSDIEPVFPIRTAAKLLNISVHTLRMYEHEGLIIPYKKSSNQRLYSQKDIERIQCIRKAINEDKLSIKGIVKIFSFIPCWKIVGCTEEDRNNCEAYNNDSVPCWAVFHKNNFCTNKDCRACEVYGNYGECNSIRNKIKELIKS